MNSRAREVTCVVHFLHNSRTLCRAGHGSPRAPGAGEPGTRPSLAHAVKPPSRLGPCNRESPPCATKPRRTTARDGPELGFIIEQSSINNVRRLRSIAGSGFLHTIYRNVARRSSRGRLLRKSETREQGKRRPRARGRRADGSPRGRSRLKRNNLVKNVQKGAVLHSSPPPHRTALPAMLQTRPASARTSATLSASVIARTGRQGLP